MVISRFFDFGFAASSLGVESADRFGELVVFLEDGGLRMFPRGAVDLRFDKFIVWIQPVSDGGFVGSRQIHLQFP